MNGGVLAPGPAAPPRREAVVPWAHRAIDLVVTYLPVLLMALLALSTWWLVKNTPLPEPVRAAAPPRHEPDYTMNGFMLQRFAPDGSLRVQIEGDTLRHYPDTDTLEIDNPRIRSFGPDGRVTVARAQRALANGDATEVELQGGAHVVREASATAAAIEFEGEFLHASTRTDRLRSHLPVRVRTGGTEVRAAGFEYDHGGRSVELKGPMRGVFDAPRRPAR